jgi:hypothetical protein
MAVVCPIVMLLLIGSLVMGLGVFRKEQIASLARGGARWAAVRGTAEGQSKRGIAAPTSATFRTDYILPRAAGLDPDNLQCTLTMAGGRATVEVRYQWTPEAFFDPVELVSTASAPITY